MNMIILVDINKIHIYGSQKLFKKRFLNVFFINTSKHTFYQIVYSYFLFFIYTRTVHVQ